MSPIVPIVVEVEKREGNLRWESLGFFVVIMRFFVGCLTKSKTVLPYRKKMESTYCCLEGYSSCLRFYFQDFFHSSFAFYWLIIASALVSIYILYEYIRSQHVSTDILEHHALSNKTPFHFTNSLSAPFSSAMLNCWCRLYRKDSSCFILLSRSSDWKTLEVYSVTLSNMNMYQTTL